jgi:hypothetical protein
MSADISAGQVGVDDVDAVIIPGGAALEVCVA